MMMLWRFEVVGGDWFVVCRWTSTKCPSGPTVPVCPFPHSTTPPGEWERRIRVLVFVAQYEALQAGHVGQPSPPLCVMLWGRGGVIRVRVRVGDPRRIPHHHCHDFMGVAVRDECARLRNDTAAAERKVGAPSPIAGKQHRCPRHFRASQTFLDPVGGVFTQGVSEVSARHHRWCLIAGISHGD